jgi:hypothetical protein
MYVILTRLDIEICKISVKNKYKPPVNYLLAVKIYIDLNVREVPYLLQNTYLNLTKAKNRDLFPCQPR